MVKSEGDKKLFSSIVGENAHSKIPCTPVTFAYRVRFLLVSRFFSLGIYVIAYMNIIHLYLAFSRFFRKFYIYYMFVWIPTR